MSNLEQLFSDAWCHNLGLNEHLTYAVINGPLNLCDLVVPTAIWKMFLPRLRINTTTGTKLEASLTFLQLEVGLIRELLSTSSCMFVYLEPCAIILTSVPGNICTPTLQGPGVFEVMRLAITHYSIACSTVINQCWSYLQVISLYDSIQYNGDDVHPQNKQDKTICAWTSKIYWADFTKPTK